MAEETTPFISAGILKDPKTLKEKIYANEEINYYWSLDWTPSFYIELAYAGFISVAMRHNDIIPVLLPELQFSYALLDWPDLHISTKIRKIIKSGRLKENDYYIRIQKDCRTTAKGIAESFGEKNWLSEEYVNLLQGLNLPGQSTRDFAIHSIELWNGRENHLVAGELGYSIGATYTSLSGFFDRKQKKYNNMGTLQLICLAEILEQSGYGFWNLGHPQLKYKMDLGAKDVPRQEFLERWIKERDRIPENTLSSYNNAHLPCTNLLQGKL